MYYDHLQVGDRVTWRAINRDYSGTVTSVGEQGVYVAIDGGGGMLLSTLRAVNAAKERKEKSLSHRSPTISITHQKGDKDAGAGGSPARG